MRYAGLVVLLAALTVTAVQAQPVLQVRLGLAHHPPDVRFLQKEATAPLLAYAPSALAAPDPSDSLPDGMPLNTRLLWGRKGLLRLLGLAPATRKRELEIRRTMLQWHQRLALVTFAALTTQVILGEVLASNRARYYQDLQPVHRTLGYATFGLYLTTASLSLGAPPARRYTPGFSSIKLHRWLALIHFTGMMLQPWLGRHLRLAPTPDSYERRLRTHRWVGRITLGAYTAAFLAILLPY
ncbi:hypothetical protein ABUL39_12970 [Rhodothermus marinus]|uniref:hypothetical protein n=1 Tax=Rhodothermus marinus TaxID=29549 RepID=UPI0037C5BAF3